MRIDVERKDVWAWIQFIRETCLLEGGRQDASDRLAYRDSATFSDGDLIVVSVPSWTGFDYPLRLIFLVIF